MLESEEQEMIVLKKYIDKRIIILCLLSVAYTLFSVYVYKETNLSIHRGMIWNLFLALIPLFISIIILILSEHNKKRTIIFLGIIWLLFFPNAPYMITGFIHLSTIRFYTSGEFEIISWLRLIHFGLGALLGILIGMVSLYQVHQTILKYQSKIKATLLMILIMLSSGYAIYIGRLLRLNSWDVLYPQMLIQELIGNFGIFALLSSLLFSFFILFTYVMYYYFIQRD